MAALGGLGDRRAAELLMEVVREPPLSDPGPGLRKRDGRALRRFAAQRLAQIGAVEAVPVLEEAARRANPRDRRAFTMAAKHLRTTVG
jgi:HEAT repeat protein